MTEFKVGDIVRLTRGEPDRPGYRVEVRTVAGGFSKSSEINLLTLRTFENAHWTVELIERPAPPLPTKPNTLGWAKFGGKRCIVRRNVYDGWDVYDCLGIEHVVSSEALSDFTEAVLIPKKLADKVMGWADDDHRRGWYTDGIMQQIADHLKGQDDE